MTAPLLFASLEPTAVSTLFSPSAAEKASRSVPHRTRRVSHTSQPQAPHVSETSTLDLIRGSLLESLSQGVIVTSRTLNPLYWNARARALCQHLSGSEFPPLELPAAVSEVCHRLMREDRSPDRPFVMECRAPTGQTIRITARWLDLTVDRDTGTAQAGTAQTGTAQTNGRSGSATVDRRTQRQSYILVLLENCNDLLREEVRIERQKYDLTEREAEVWMLLRQEYTYQEMAKMLQISLNTVKTHVKNVYAKKRSCQGRDKFWCGG